jgi:surface antigen
MRKIFIVFFSVCILGAGLLSLFVPTHAHAASLDQNLGSILWAGGRMYQNQYLQSPNGQYVLYMQTDGNVVEYNRWNGWSVPWASNTGGRYGAWATLQGDGNFVLYNANGSWAGWSLGNVGFTNAILSMQDDGNVVEYSAGYAVWASNWHRYFGHIQNNVTVRTYNAFTNGECTYFAAQQIHDFWNQHWYPNLWWADAQTWDVKMAVLGFQVYTQPMTEAVVVFPYSENHVAWVDYVVKDGNTYHMWIREMNYDRQVTPNHITGREVDYRPGMHFIPAPAV